MSAIIPKCMLVKVTNLAKWVCNFVMIEANWVKGQVLLDEKWMKNWVLNAWVMRLKDARLLLLPLGRLYGLYMKWDSLAFNVWERQYSRLWCHLLSKIRAQFTLVCIPPIHRSHNLFACLMVFQRLYRYMLEIEQNPCFQADRHLTYPSQFDPSSPPAL